MFVSAFHPEAVNLFFCRVAEKTLCYTLVQLLSHVHLFAIPRTVACQAPLSMGFPRKEYRSGLPFPSREDLPDPGIVPVSPALQADSLPLSHLYYLNSVQSLSHVRLFVTLRTAACQASLSITNSQSLLKLMSIKSVMPSNHLILCHPLLLLPSVLPSIRVFSNESVLRIRWPKYWSFSFSISPSNAYSGLMPLGLTGLISLQSKGLERIFSSTTITLNYTKLETHMCLIHTK